MNFRQHIIGIILVLCVTFSSQLSFGQYGSWAVGARIGDPMALSAKKYDRATGRARQPVSSWELSLGFPWFYRPYDFETFYLNAKDYENLEIENPGYSPSFAFAAKFDFYVHANVSGFLQAYFGGGAQFRAINGVLSYSIVHSNSNIEEGLEDQVTDIDFGPEGVVGLEYSFETMPLNIFVDITGFIELADRVAFHPQFGFGGRIVIP